MESDTKTRSIQDQLEFLVQENQRLYEELEKYKLITDNTFDMERWLLPDKTLAYISPSCERITGYSQMEHYKNPLLLVEIVHPEDRVKFEEQLNHSYEGKLVEPDPVRITTKGGDLKWIGIAINEVTDKEGNHFGYRTSTRDITHLMELEEQLEHSRNLYSKILEDQLDILMRFKPDGTIIYANKALLELYHLEEKDITGTKWQENIPGENFDRVSQILKTMSPENPVARFIFDYNLPDGSVRYIDWAIRVFYNNAGVAIENQLVGRDITELKNTQDLLQEALDQVQNLKDELEKENRYLREINNSAEAEEGIISQSPLMTEIFNKVKQVASTDSPVLITGETGTGKELVAQAIHNLSKRSRKLMVTVNCAALPPALIESELFGRERGAYTGAMSSQIGRFQLANGSTLFLDEVGELPLETQVKLLRVLQFGEFQMLGTPVSKKVDVRIIAATNRNLDEAVEKGIFRADLLYRLKVFPISMPPLRDRKEDLPLLIWQFIDELSGKIGRKIDKITPTSMSDVKRYAWPGNVRELRNIIEYSLIMCSGSILEIRMPDVKNEDQYSDSLDYSQRSHIERVLNQTGWRIRGIDGAAERLGMKESTLRYRMKKLGIERK